MRRLAVALVLAAAALPVTVAPARERLDTDVFALIPRPGFPAMAYVGPNRRVYEGTYTNPDGDTVASRVFEYDAGGALLRSWTIRGQHLDSDHGVQVGTMTRSGRLLLLDKNPPRVIRLNRTSGRQADYARFKAGVIPNYAAWGPTGALYVTDYEGATIWRVPRGGGEPRRWLEAPELDGGPFGTTGILLAADRRTLIVSQQSSAGFGAGDPTTGKLLKIPIQPDGKPGAIETLWESRPADGPDGFAIARSGTFYVSLLLANQIAVVEPDGTERERFDAGDSPVPFDAPSSARFLGTRLMVANQAFVSGDATHQAILDVEVGESGLKELIPRLRKRR